MDLKPPGSSGSTRPSSGNVRLLQRAKQNWNKAQIQLSHDYGIMEKAASVKVIPGDFGWNDVGSWLAVYELFEKDKDSNALEALNYCLIDSNNNLIFSKSEKVIALVGVKNMAVVETEKALLVCDLQNVQRVKEVVEQLNASKELKSFT